MLAKGELDIELSFMAQTVKLLLHNIRHICALFAQKSYSIVLLEPQIK